MRKLLVTLDINYHKEITEITYPYMQFYANKIGADFKIITEKKFSSQSTNIEKFQLYELSKNYDWTIFIDADALIHPNCPDVTEIYEKHTVIFNNYDLYPLRFKPNNYTRRDKRNIGAATWFTVFSDWTRHLWKPYEDPKKYMSEINLLYTEKNFGYSTAHILDDYLVSRNIAKYGIKVKTIENDIFDDHPNFKINFPLLVHQYGIDREKKINLLKKSHTRIQTEIRNFKPYTEEKIKKINYS
jgi:hypothetical protein